MKTEQVRCWKVGVGGKLFITYPEGEMGHRLIFCNRCGKVHAVNVAKQLYIEPDLERHLNSVKCWACNKFLSGNWAYYPDDYLDEGGRIQHFERSHRFPEDADSIVAEFPEVFS